MFEKIAAAFSLNVNDYAVIPFGTGLINHTWKLQSKTSDTAYILQRVNQSVFKKPEDIAWNIRLIEKYLNACYPDYLFIAPVKTTTGADFYLDAETGFFRLFPFLNHSHSIDVVHTPQQAFEAARQFALFAKLLSGFDAQNLKITLPHFHDLTLRFSQFKEALQKGNPERISQSQPSIDYLLQQEYIVTIFEDIKRNPDFKIRVTHHDTKISNVLFDDKDNGLCVIDLDTVMPGYFISDVGDMMRTYLSPANEEIADFSKIEVRDEFFEAIIAGYLSEMKDELTAVEREHFVYAAKFLIYMQALRFLTDYILNDVYYGSKYEGHNFVRANNQIALLQIVEKKESQLNAIVADCLHHPSTIKEPFSASSLKSK